MLLRQLFDDPVQFILAVPCILIALTFHEWSHGFAAYKCGDNTARNMGRLSLNILHHLDPVGTLMMLIAGFGWAKPVPVNPRNFRHPRRDFAIVAAAGPLMNFILAFAGAFFAILISVIGYDPIYMYLLGEGTFFGAFLFYAEQFFDLFAFMNIGLGVFNLIPLPPLDGSRIVSWLLPPKASMYYNRIEMYAQYIFLGIIILTWLPEPLSNVADWIFFPVDWLRGKIYIGFLSFWNMILG